jgi:hypothetical protein
MLPARVLRAAGFSASEVDVITAEVATLPMPVLDRDELWAEAIAAAWLARHRRPDVGAAYLRVRVRGALRDAIRRENRACGRTWRTFYWPWFRPAGEEMVRRCEDCGGAVLAKRRLCAGCGEARERERIRRRNEERRQVAA